MGALLPCASSTMRMICASIVSFPTRVALKWKLPILLIVAPMTVSPGFFSTGMLSPVIIDSSMVEAPSITMPSTGTFSPGLTITISSANTSSILIAASCPFLITVAFLGRRPISFLMASEVCPLALASRNRPIRISAMIIDEVSK